MTSRVPGLCERRFRLVLLTMWFAAATCTLVSTTSGAGGRVVTWGSDYYGESDVPASATNIVAIAAGPVHTLALNDRGELLAWGASDAVPPAGVSNLVAIAAGGFHSMGLRPDGSLWIWSPSAAVMAVPASATNLVKMSAGDSHVMALRADGRVIAWGDNYWGQCDVPPAASNVVDIAAGGIHSLALRADGSVLSWGQITRIPPSVTNVVRIGATFDHCLALRRDGTVVEWDQYNDYATPAFNDFVDISNGGAPHWVALRRNGTVAAWCWTSSPGVNVPPGLDNVTAIAAGGEHSVALVDYSGLQFYSQPRSFIVLAGEPMMLSCEARGAMPITYSWTRNGTDLTSASQRFLMLPDVQVNDQGVYLAIATNITGSITSSPALLNVIASPPRIQLSATHLVGLPGDSVSLTATVRGTEPIGIRWQKNNTDLPGETNATLTLSNLAWADSALYRLAATNAPGTAASDPVPIIVVQAAVWGSSLTFQTNVPPAATNLVAAAAGGIHVLGLHDDGSLLAWGDDNAGMSVVPPAATNVVAVAAGEMINMALPQNGTPVVWGYNTYGQTNVPADLTNAIAISAGSSHCLALRQDGTVAAWGNGADGRTSVPPAATNIVAVAAGGNHSLALCDDGAVLAWGQNIYGQTTIPASVTNICMIAAGGLHSLALKRDGTVLAWGDDSAGQCEVPAQATNIVAVAAAGNFSMALRQDGQVIGWGDNANNRTVTPPLVTNVNAIAAGSGVNVALVDRGVASLTGPAMNRTSIAGDNLVLLASAFGRLPLSFQWFFDGSVIPGATNSWLMLHDMQQFAAGSYAVAVGSGATVLTGTVATVTVTPRAPIIVQQPTNRLALPGAATTFSVSAKGTEPLSYQWQFDGADLTGQTNSALVLTAVQLAGSGDYQVIVSNALGAVTSTVARLEVYPFNLISALATTQSALSADWGDYDNDGRLDLLVGGRAGALIAFAPVRLFHNLGGGNFAEVQPGISFSALSVAWGDFDNDGFLDALVVGSGSARIWHNNGDGTFTNLSQVLPANYGTVGTVVDFDGDGRLDVSLGGRLYRNLGDNLFTNVNANLPSVQYGTATWGDYDGDGKPDVLINGLAGGSAQFRLYRNCGNNTFTNVAAGFQDIYGGAGVWLDYNADGHLDVLVSGLTGPGMRLTMLYRNNGDGSFTAVTSGLPALGNTWLATADCDNDGLPDVFLNGNNGTNYLCRLFRGETTGAFTSIPSIFPTNMPSVASWGDYDRDGRLDLALNTVISNKTTVGIFRNDLTVTNTRPTAPPAAAAVAGVNSIIFEWAPGTDLQTAIPSLTYGLRVGTSPGACDVLTSDADANGIRRVERPGNAGLCTSLTLTNLPFGRYYWAVQTVDSGLEGSPFTPEHTFAYEAATLPATDVTSSEATLNGEWDTNVLPATVYFEWGATTNYDHQTAAQQAGTNSPGTISIALAGLLPGMEYHYRLVVTNAAGAYAGGDATFATVDLPQITPQIATEITSSSATLNALVNPNRGITAVSFEYGLTRSYGTATVATNLGNGSSPVPVSQRITGLLAGRVYHFRVLGTNEAGMVYAADQTFQTTTEPTVTTTAASQIGTTGAHLNALVNANGSETLVAFEYGSTTAYGNSTAATNIGDATNAVTVSLPVGGLTAARAYHFRAVATNSSGASLGGDVTFHTLPPFAAASNEFAGAYFGQSSFVDYNNDGRLDIHIMGTERFLIGTTNTATFSILYRNEGNGVFVPTEAGLAGVYFGAAAWGDFDNDGFLDVAIAGYSGGAATARIYHNNGDGTFTDIGAGLTPVGYAALAWGDYNNDGRLDLLLTGNSGNGLVSQIYRNDGGVFTNINAGLVGVYQGSVAWGDYDNDGWPDILLTGDTGAYTAVSRIYRNNHDGTFTDINASITPAGTSSAAWGDYNNDGRLDILLTGSSNTFDSGRFTQIYRNDGNGVFTPVDPGFPAVRGGSVAWGDYDNDGRLDVLLTGYGVANVYRNNGDGTFSNAQAGLMAVSSSSAAWGDYDGDGRLDILVSGDTGAARISRLYHNRNTPTNTPPLSPENLVATPDNGNFHLSWDAAADSQTTSNGLTYNLRIGTNPGGQDVLSPSAASDGTRRIARPGSAGHSTEATITGLSGGVYYWSVQAVDTAFAGSAFAPEARFVIPASPETVTLSAADVTATGAELRGSVSANGLATDAWFEWGTSTNLGYPVAAGPLAPDSDAVTLAVRLTGLSPGQHYFFRVAATNNLGANVGNILSFQTAEVPGIVTARLLPNGAVLLQFPASSGFQYRVLASTNLVDWTYAGTAEDTGTNLYQFTDQTGIGIPVRFYRIVLP